MRIDTALMPQIPGLVTAPSQPGGRTLPFDAFFTAPQPDDAKTAATAAPVLSPYVFGFDTVGLLGLGGPAGIGAPSKSASQAGTIPGDRPLSPLRDAAQKPVVPVYAAVPYAAFSTVSSQPATVAAVEAVTFPPAHIRATMTPPGQAAALAWGSATPSRSAFAEPAQAVGRPTVTPIASLPVTSGLRAIADARDVPVAARKAPAAFRFEPETEALSGQVSVTVSEGEDVLHIVAATPDLSESDRRTLKAVADEAAAEAGIKLGELRLNGVVVRHLSRTR